MDFNWQSLSSNSNPVSYWVTWQTNRELYTRTDQTVFTIFCFQKMFLNDKIGTTMFYVAYRTLPVMLCVLKFYFVDFYGMFTSSPTWRLKMHVLCKVGKSIIFQNKTLLVLFYRHNMELTKPIIWLCRNHRLAGQSLYWYDIETGAMGVCLPHSN